MRVPEYFVFDANAVERFQDSSERRTAITIVFGLFVDFFEIRICNVNS